MEAILGVLSNIAWGIGAFVLLVVIVVIALRSYIKVPTDEVAIISGKRKEPKMAMGRGVMKWPFVDTVNYLTLKVIDIDVKTAIPVPTADFIGVRVDATVNAKIPSDNPEMLKAASQNFLNMDTAAIAAIVQPVLEGNIREIIGRMELKTMVGDRQKFAQLVKENAEPDLRALGLEIKTFNVQNFVDDQNVIASLGIEMETTIKKEASVAKARNEQTIREEVAAAESAANDAEVKSKTEIAERENLLRIKRAELKQESDARQAEADVSYKIQEEEQRKTLEQKTVDAEIARTDREAELKRKQVEVEQQRLEAEISKKADAEKYAAQQAADADLYRRQKAAEAEKAELQAKAEADLIRAKNEAAAERARAEAKKFAKEQEAAAIAAVGEAEAKAIAAKGQAEAEAIDKKAEAMKKYGQAATLEMMIDVLPQMAEKIAAPLSTIDEVKIIGGTGDGVSSVSGNMPVMMKQVFDTMQAATGIDMTDLVRASGAEAKMNRNITVQNGTVVGGIPMTDKQDDDDDSLDIDLADTEIIEGESIAVDDVADAVIANIVDGSLE